MSRQLSLANCLGKKRKVDDGGLSSSSSECAKDSEEIETLPSTSSKTKPLQANKGKKVARKFNESWLKDFPWVKYIKESGQMFCSVCEQYPHLADKKTKLVQGTDILKRETLVLHSKSKAHFKCEEHKKVVENPCQQPLARAARRMQASKYKHLTVLFNTSYYVAKQNLSFMSFSGLCGLQEKNGIPVEDQYVHNQKCGEFVEHIAAVLRDETQSSMNADSSTRARPFSIICDSSTDRAMLENCNIYVKFTDEDSPKTMLWKVIPLEQANADGYSQKLKKVLALKTGTNERFHFSFRGRWASVMSGCEGGLFGKIKQEIPKVIYVHCIAHRLQLALQDAWKKIPYMSTFDTTICSIYALYHRSPKKTTQLEEIAAICNQTVNKFHTIHAVRWVASKHRATKALVKNLKPTILHLQNMGAADTTDAATARGLLKTISSYRFVSFLHFVTDYLTPLEQLSVTLQKDTIVAAQLPHVINSTIISLDNLKESPKSGSFSEMFFQRSWRDKFVPWYCFERHWGERLLCRAFSKTCSRNEKLPYKSA
ncbi:putative zinc finger protein [Apostichopus japonicus]|uniref:Putative zinc finger protein n=1 Tax=Stichopus japonicus TaxID=307972 RepID=A0A2G8JNQ1_STIJA|nr:putative zinc finger protein [Apostichopus japonicus]